METLIGLVERIELVEKKQYGRVADGYYRVTIAVSAKLTLSDGKTGYVETGVAERVYSSSLGPSGASWVNLSLTSKRSTYPWVVVDKRVVDSEPTDVVTLTVWMGDIITVDGEVLPKISGYGNLYMSIKRAVITNWHRPDWVLENYEEAEPIITGPRRAQITEVPRKELHDESIVPDDLPF
jgi:hypothetical protein